MEKITLEIILTKNKVVSTEVDKSRMKYFTISIKNVKYILSWPAPLARWSYQSVGRPKTFRETAKVIKRDEKLKITQDYF